MKRFLVLTLLLLICLFMNSIFIDARHQVTTVDNETVWIHSDVPDTEKYVLDEEANKDKLYCKIKSDAEGNVIQTDWYYYCTGEFVRSEEADTCTREFRYPEYECVFAKGSNADKIYCRTIKDGEGAVVETRWFNYCSNELVKTEEADTCTKEFKSPAYKCYKEEIEEEEEAVEELPEEETKEEETVEIPPEETVTEEPDVTPVTKMDNTWIWISAVFIAIIIVAVMFLKKKKSKEEKPKKEK